MGGGPDEQLVETQIQRGNLNWVFISHRGHVLWGFALLFALLSAGPRPRWSRSAEVALRADPDFPGAIARCSVKKETRRSAQRELAR